jgi:nucleotide-binding universal stress UspA family protein
MFKHILLPTDGSVLSETAIKKGVEFAREINAKVRARCEISGPDPIASPKAWEGSCNSSRRETNQGAAGRHPARRD